MDEKRAHLLGNAYRDLILARTGLKKEELECPREKSDMTPCIARDGGIVVVLDSSVTPICVGCEFALIPLLKKELEKL